MQSYSVVLFVHLLICGRPICIVALTSIFPPPVLGREPRALHMLGKDLNAASLGDTSLCVCRIICLDMSCLVDICRRPILF